MNEKYICCSCEMSVQNGEELVEAYRPMLGIGSEIAEMECIDCSKLSDVEWMKEMDKKWNEKIADEYNSEFEREIELENKDL